jgi:hypothetical protein
MWSILLLLLLGAVGIVLWAWKKRLPPVPDDLRRADDEPPPDPDLYIDRWVWRGGRQ